MTMTFSWSSLKKGSLLVYTKEPAPYTRLRLFLGFNDDGDCQALDELGDVVLLSPFEYVYELLCEGVD